MYQNRRFIVAHGTSEMLFSRFKRANEAHDNHVRSLQNNCGNCTWNKFSIFILC